MGNKQSSDKPKTKSLYIIFFKNSEMHILGKRLDAKINNMYLAEEKGETSILFISSLNNLDKDQTLINMKKMFDKFNVLIYDCNVDEEDVKWVATNFDINILYFANDAVYEKYSTILTRKLPRYIDTFNFIHSDKQRHEEQIWINYFVYGIENDLTRPSRGSKIQFS